MGEHNGVAEIVLVDPTTMLPYAAGSPFDPASIEALGAVDDAAVSNPASDGSLIALGKGELTLLTLLLAVLSAKYETVAASQTAQVLGTTGAAGDHITGLLVIPATTSPGLVTLLDGATSIPVFVGGATSVADLKPFMIPVGAKSVSGAWKVTTGANVSVIGVGNFT